MQTTVINLYDQDAVDRAGDRLVYIGRENRRKGLSESRWANPYRLEPEADGAARDEVVERYRAYILRQIGDGWLDPTELQGKVLACWCAPKACHGDVLAEIADGTDMVPSAISLWGSD